MKITVKMGLIKALTKIVEVIKAQAKKQMKTNQIMMTLRKMRTKARVIERKIKKGKPMKSSKVPPSKTQCLQLETFYLIWTC